MSRQDQSAEDGAIQALAGRDAKIVVYQGLTPEAVNELMEAAIAKAAQQYALVAREEALTNARSFANILVQELVGIGRLDVLADPAFLHLLDKANIKAATTKEPTEHNMLAKLLAERAERRDRPTWAAIDRAVEVVPLLDARALTGLTVMDAAIRWATRSPWLNPGLTSLNSIYEQLMVDELPVGGDWLDHLDSQDCIRITGVTGDGFIPFIDWFAQNHPGYVCRGFSSEEGDSYVNRFALPPFSNIPIFIEHELLTGRRRPVWAHHSRAAEVLVASGFHEAAAKHVQELATQEPALSNVDEEAKSALASKLEQFPYLDRLRSFWNEIPLSFRLTQVGKVVARANARQLDKAGVIPVIDD